MALCRWKPRGALEHAASRFELLKRSRPALSSLIGAPWSAAAPSSSSSSSSLSKLICRSRADWVGRTPRYCPRRFESTVAEKLPRFANGVAGNLVKFDNCDGNLEVLIHEGMLRLVAFHASER